MSEFLEMTLSRFNGCLLCYTHLLVVLLGIKLPVTSCTYIVLCSQSLQERTCTISAMYLAYKNQKVTFSFIFNHGKSDLPRSQRTCTEEPTLPEF